MNTSCGVISTDYFRYLLVGTASTRAEPSILRRTGVGEFGFGSPCAINGKVSVQKTAAVNNKRRVRESDRSENIRNLPRAIEEYSIVKRFYRMYRSCGN